MSEQNQGQGMQISFEDVKSEIAELYLQKRYLEKVSFSMQSVIDNQKKVISSYENVINANPETKKQLEVILAKNDNG